MEINPQNIAIKTLNQYRKRDIIAYLSLRYYLDSKCSRTDLWASEVAVKLALKNNTMNFLKTRHFKGVRENELKFRDIFLPSPNDMIAESQLIIECSKYEAFRSTASVYSYLFSSDPKSVYKQYVHGLKQRFESIRRVCMSNPSGEVLYVDIKSFYSSIKLTKVVEAWGAACENSKISDRYKELGFHFLNKYQLIQENKKEAGLPVGPMFSHLLANITFKEIDRIMERTTNGRYWRYVDDIILVGQPSELESYFAELSKLVDDLGLEFHEEGKTFRITTEKWLKNKQAIDKSLSKKWPQLIGKIKKFTVLHPTDVELLKELFVENNIRIEVLTLSKEVKSKSLGEKMINWLIKNFQFNDVSPSEIMNDIYSLRKDLLEELSLTIEFVHKNELELKTKATRLKYITGRLLYIANEEELKTISELLESIPELRLQYEISIAVQNEDITRIVKLGSNVAQAAAQVIKQKTNQVSCGSLDLGVHEYQALSIFEFHGIHVKFNQEISSKDDLFDFATGKIESAINSENNFIDEFASLHGRKESKHKETLESLFDENEELSFDVINNGSGSSYSIS
jgi:hypothetical protein